jgi:hypothetical protein
VSFSTFQTQKLTSSRTEFHDCNCWIWSFYSFYVRKSANSCIPYSCENVVARRWVLVHSGLWRLESNWALLVGSLLRLSWNPGLDPLWPRPPDDFVHFGGQRRLLEFWLLELKLWLSKNKNCIINCYFILPIWGLGALPPVGSRGKAPGRETGSEAPEADSIFLSEYD